MDRVARSKLGKSESKYRPVYVRSEDQKMMRELMEFYNITSDSQLFRFCLKREYDRVVKSNSLTDN